MSNEPSNYVLDNKDASYYRNRYLNNCTTRLRYLNQMYNRLKSSENIFDLYTPLDVNSWAEYNKTDFVALRETYETLLEKIKDMIEFVQEEKQNLLAVDFEGVMKKTVEEIEKKENEKNLGNKKEENWEDKA